MERSKCSLCGGAVVSRKATGERPYRYEMSGLDSVFLVGILVHECEKCGAKVPVIPKIAGLHSAIAKHLVFKKDVLTGKEIKFLRKNVGIPAKEFASLIEVDPSHLSRVENGKTEAFGPSTDKLIRAVAMAAANGKEVRKVLLQMAEERLGPKQLTLFGMKKDHWERIAA